MSDIPSYDQLLKMQNSPDHQTPMQKEYNKLVADNERLTQAILMQMRQMIGKNINPDWDGFSKTRTWMLLSVNITEANREHYRKRWCELYEQLLEVKLDGNEPEPAAGDDADGAGSDQGSAESKAGD